MKAGIKFDFKKRILPAVAAIVAFALVVLLIIVTRKTEVDASVSVGGKTYSATNKMKILEIVPNEAYEAIGPLVSDSQGYVKWTDIVSKQPKGDNSKFTDYLNDEVRNYLSAINQTICYSNMPNDSHNLQARLCNKLTGDTYTYINSYVSTVDTDIAKKLNYDLNNFELRFYKKNDSGSFEALKKSDGSGYMRNIFSYAVFESSKMEDFTEVVFKRASDVTVADIDSAALVYFSRYSNDYLKELANAKYGSTLPSVTNWSKGSNDLKASVAIHLYIENISGGKAVLYSSSEKDTDSNIAKICLMIDGIDGDYFIKDFAYNYNSDNNKRLYEGQKGWVDVSNEKDLKLYLKESATDSSKKNFELPFSSTMFINSTYGYATEANNNKNTYPCYNAKTHQQALRRFSLEQNSENAFVQGFEKNMGTSDDFDSSGKYNGTYYDDARKALGLEEGSDIKYSQGIRYILGDFDTSEITTIKVLEVEPAGYYRYDDTNLEDLSNIRRWFSLSTELNPAGTAFVEPYNITVEHCSMNAFIGKNVDLAAEYDLIIVGAYGKENIDKSILGNIYSKGSSWPDGKGLSVSGAKLNGNDMTDKMYDQLFDYVLRGMPIIFDKCLYFGDTDVTDKNTNMYKFRVDQFMNDVFAQKGSNGNITYTDISQKGEQKIAILLKYIRKPATVIYSTLSDYNGSVETIYSVDGSTTNSAPKDEDGNIKVTFTSGSNALPGGTYRIKIYIDRNQDGVFADDITSDKKELLYYGTDEGVPKDSSGNVIRDSETELYYGRLFTSDGSKSFKYDVILPEASRGYFAWKVEIIKVTGANTKSVAKLKYNAKSIRTGAFAIRGDSATVKVLQINDGVGNLDISSEKSAFNEKFNKASTMTGLNLAVTRRTVAEANAFGTTSAEIYEKLNQYSMLVLGMEDNYGKTYDLSDELTDAIKQYIEDGNAVLFTHDTMAYTNASSTNGVSTYEELKYTTKQLLPMIGMKTQYTDMLALRQAKRSNSAKYKYPYKWNGSFAELTYSIRNTTKVSMLNDGQITEYPYKVSGTDMTVAQTHGQYFALNLEKNVPAYNDSTDGSMKSQAVVWYTLKDGDDNYYSYNGQDAMSNYYIYSYDNVTYTSAGHREVTGASELELFVNTFTRAMLSGNNNPEVIYTDAAFDETTTKYKSYYKNNYEKFAKSQLSFKFRIVDADLISSSDYISDAFMYIYEDDDSREDGKYDASKDIYLGKINATTVEKKDSTGRVVTDSSGNPVMTPSISLTGSSSSVIVGKEYTVENFWDVIDELNATKSASEKINITALRSKLKDGTLKIGIQATDGSDGVGCAILRNECRDLFELD